MVYTIKKVTSDKCENCLLYFSILIPQNIDNDLKEGFWLQEKKSEIKMAILVLKIIIEKGATNGKPTYNAFST